MGTIGQEKNALSGIVVQDWFILCKSYSSSGSATGTPRCSTGVEKTIWV